eukprot:ctg_1126.g438
MHLPHSNWSGATSVVSRNRSPLLVGPTNASQTGRPGTKCIARITALRKVYRWGHPTALMTSAAVKHIGQAFGSECRLAWALLVQGPQRMPVPWRWHRWSALGARGASHGFAAPGWMLVFWAVYLAGIVGLRGVSRVLSFQRSRSLGRWLRTLRLLLAVHVLPLQTVRAVGYAVANGARQAADRPARVASSVGGGRGVVLATVWSDVCGLRHAVQYRRAYADVQLFCVRLAGVALSAQAVHHPVPDRAVRGQFRAHGAVPVAVCAASPRLPGHAGAAGEHVLQCLVSGAVCSVLQAHLRAAACPQGALGASW